MNHVETEALIMRVAKHDRAAFDALYDLAAPRLYGLLLKLLGEQQQADAALAEVFAKIWYNAGRYPASGYTPVAWLVSLARNHAIDRRRASRGAEAAEQVFTLPPKGKIAEALANHDPAFRQALLCAYLAGMSYSDIAAQTGTPREALTNMMRSGLAALREELTT